MVDVRRGLLIQSPVMRGGAEMDADGTRGSRRSRKAAANDCGGDAQTAGIQTAILESAVVGVAVNDAAGTCRFFNRGAELITGYSTGEVVGAPAPALFSAEDRERIERALAAVGMVENMECGLRRKDGSRTDVTLSVSACCGEAGGISGGRIQFLIDNTEKRYLQDLLIQSQRMEAVRMIAGGIAHDFNNLLAGILGYTTFMMDLVAEGQELRRYLEIVERSAKRASDLTERLLTFSRERAREKKAVQCNAVLHEVAKLLERSIDSRIIIELNLNRELATVSGSPGQIEQAFLAVCLNARDAMPEGGKLMISSDNVSLDGTHPRMSYKMKKGRYVRVSISDTGIGMTKDTLGKIFEPFFSSKERGVGTGLGLNLVYEIVDSHDGFMNVYSEVGRGTLVTVYLPAEEQAVAESTAGEFAQAAPVAAPAGRGELILFVDDEPIVRSFGRDMLGRLSYRALTAADAAEGLRIFKDRMGDIDLVILDMVLPGSRGSDVLATMRTLRPDIAVLLTSGYSRGYFGDLIGPGKGIEFIQKPYSMEELASAVRRLLDARMSGA
jgi:two-component system cell cycle sensor histidine kinase/response regulator CckA